MKSQHLKAVTVSKMGKLMREEVQVMCSNKSDSILRCTDPKALCDFKCELVINEMVKYAPT